MTTTAPRWRGYTAEQRRAEMERVRAGRDRATLGPGALDRRIDDLAACAATLTDEQKTRLAVVLTQAGRGGE
jgi:hypothetical protein